MHGRFKWPGASALQFRDFRLFWIGYASEVIWVRVKK